MNKTKEGIERCWNQGKANKAKAKYYTSVYKVKPWISEAMQWDLLGPRQVM